jgi:hypothetical protein
MPAPSSPFDHHVRLLLEGLVSTARAAALSLDDWDFIMRAARRARLLGVVRARLKRDHLLEAIPPQVRAHLDGASAVAAYRRQMVLREMHAVAKVLQPRGIPLILLKGGAYIAQGLRCAEGRLPEDLDLMVPRGRLDEAEHALIEAGWTFEKTDPYDQRYYRAWSHELPPMRFPGHAMELDVHHTILPPTGRVRVDGQALVESAVPIPGSPFLALSPTDQVLHACAHLFQDSDCVGRLRDLVDIDALVREHASLPGFWATLLARARFHRLGRCFWYATRYSSAWLQTPIPAEAAAEVAQFRPSTATSAAMDRLIRRALVPHVRGERPGFITRLARSSLLARSMWLRMPPWLLAYHSLAKAARSMRKPRAAEEQ